MSIHLIWKYFPSTNWFGETIRLESWRFSCCVRIICATVGARLKFYRACWTCVAQFTRIENHTSPPNLLNILFEIWRRQISLAYCAFVQSISSCRATEHPIVLGPINCVRTLGTDAVLLYVEGPNARVFIPRIILLRRT